MNKTSGGYRKKGKLNMSNELSLDAVFTADVVDRRIRTLKWWRDETRPPLDSWYRDYEAEYDRLVSFKRELGSDWKDSLTFIPDEQFQAFTYDLAKDIVSEGLESWPLSCIDWDRAEKELKSDYVSFEFREETYWYRP